MRMRKAANADGLVRCTGENDIQAVLYYVQTAAIVQTGGGDTPHKQSK